MEFGFLAWKSIHKFLGNHLSVLGVGQSWSEVLGYLYRLFLYSLGLQLEHAFLKEEQEAKSDN